MSGAWTDGLKTLCKAQCSFEQTGQTLSIFLPASSLLEAVKRLHGAQYFLEDVSVADVAEGFLVVYHFDHFQKPGRVTLRVIVDRAKPEIPSIASIFTGADWHERESHDFYGVVFTGHPNLIPLLLDPEAGIHPLVKKDKERKPLRKVMKPGEILECDPAFTLFEGADDDEEASGDDEGEEGADD